MKKRIRCIASAAICVTGIAHIGWTLHDTSNPASIAMFLGLLGIAIVLLAMIFKTLEEYEEHEEHENKQ